MNQDYATDRCKSEIEKHLNWGPSSQWENQEFEELSQLIFNKTGVNLSHTTLKRVWGKVKYDNKPSISTLDAMARFLDYASWSAFKRDQEIPAKPISRKPVRLGSKRLAFALVLIVLIGFSGWYIITSNVSTDPELAEQLMFETKYSAMGLPNTVIFSFDASGLKADNYAIQQSWDRTKRIPVTNDQKRATCVYYYPGYFRSKFVADDVVIKEADIFIETEGWQSTINTEPHPVYLSDRDLQKTGVLKLSDNGRKHLARHHKPVSYHYYKRDERINGSQFEFETSIRYEMANKVSACKYAKVVLHFTEGIFLVPFVIPGCVGEANLMVMDRFISGKENDLSAFGVRLDEWKKIGIRSENKKLSVLIDGETIYSAAFERAPGHLVGISYQFDGSGEVDYLTLTNGAHEWRFDETF